MDTACRPEPFDPNASFCVRRGAPVRDLSAFESGHDGRVDQEITGMIVRGFVCAQNAVLIRFLRIVQFRQLANQRGQIANASRSDMETRWSDWRRVGRSFVGFVIPKSLG